MIFCIFHQRFKSVVTNFLNSIVFDVWSIKRYFINYLKKNISEKNNDKINYKLSVRLKKQEQANHLNFPFKNVQL